MPTMLMVSCRRDFWSPTEFSATDEIRRVDLDSGAGTPVSQTEFLQELGLKRLTVLTHGYNNDERDVIDVPAPSIARCASSAFLAAPAPLTTRWSASRGRAEPSACRFRLRGSEPGKARPFARLLAELRSATSLIDLNTHSLGADVVFEALRSGAQRLVRNAWNFASAVDNESIEDGERYYEASRRCERFYVFHSRNDPVLRVWYRVGDLPDFDTALGYSGPEDPGAIIKRSSNVRVVNCKDVVQSHGGYRSSGQVWAYMSQQLTKPSGTQFVTLAKTPEALNAVFRVADGGSSGTRRVARSGKRGHA